MKKYINKLRELPAKVKILSFLAVVLILNSTGFCYSEFKYMSDWELMNTYVLGSNWKSMTYEQRASYFKAKGMEYPDCCIVAHSFFPVQGLGEAIYALIGNPLYTIELNYKLEHPSEENFPFYSDNVAMGCCGQPQHDSYGMSIKKGEYLSNLKSNQRAWAYQSDDIDVEIPKRDYSKLD